MKVKSWKTTLFGILSIISATSVTLQKMLDGDPHTEPDWNALGVVVLTAIGLIFARDANKSSEDHGLKPQTTITNNTDTKTQ